MTHDEPYDDGNLSTTEHAKEAIAGKFAETSEEASKPVITKKDVLAKFDQFEIEKDARKGYPHSNGGAHFG